MEEPRSACPAIRTGFAEVWPEGSILAKWDFGVGIGMTAITDGGPAGRHGTLIDLPEGSGLRHFVADTHLLATSSTVNWAACGAGAGGHRNASPR